MRLLTIPISHYCERARWALEYAGLAYHEEQHLQLFHYRPTRLAGGGTTVPVLVTGAGETLVNSTDIVRYADARASAEQRLYPQDPAAREATIALENTLTEPLGVEARRVMYEHFFRWGRRSLSFNGGRAPWYQRQVAWLAFPLVEWHARRYLDVSPSSVERALAIVSDVFTLVEQRLADGRRFLMGPRFTAADLTFACMAAPVLVPSPYGTPLPPPAAFPAETQAVLKRFRTRPAGRFALRMFAEHRPPPAASPPSSPQTNEN